MTYILGLNCVYHESAVCLLHNNSIVAYIEEERLSRVKHAKLSSIENASVLPHHAIEYCLKQQRIQLSDIDYIGVSFVPEKRLHNKDYPDIVIEGSWGSATGEDLLYQNLQAIPRFFHTQGFKGEFMWLSHHDCHLASSFYLSPYKEAISIVVDGIAEVDSTVVAYMNENTLDNILSIRYPNSIGFLWEKLCLFLGFGEYDACKVMGLASYGNPEKFYNEFSRIVKIYDDGCFEVDNDILQFRAPQYDKISQVFGIAKRDKKDPLSSCHYDLAATLQQMTNKILLQLATTAYQHTNCANLCLSGGVALNCVSNAHTFHNSPFDNLYIPPVANDAGTALGAAFWIWHMLLNNNKTNGGFSPYMGPEYDDSTVELLLREHDLAYEKCNNIAQRVAKLLEEQKIVGWFQGKMEIGPRALGNRSLLADPRAAHMRDLLNNKVKFREDFRPFAPSVLQEEAHKWFDIPKDTNCARYMLMTYDIHKEKSDQVPAVVHVDGTSRIQLISSETNDKFYQLIRCFFENTGVPMILNTSFNCDEPIVCTPTDAIRTFMNTQIDYLAINNYLVTKKVNPCPQS